MLRVHVEVFADSIGLNKPVSIFRANPMTVSLKPDPFLTEAQVLGAKVIEDPAGFSLQIKFDRRGTQLLESVTASNPGRHLAIFCEFGEKLDKVRWLAAPVISRRISNGLLVFTPDADREEAEQVALGLNNVARETQPGLPDEK